MTGSKATTVAEYAVNRLAKLGTPDRFGLSGDFSSLFEDAIIDNESIQWRGCANELNGSMGVSARRLFCLQASSQ
jgi:TPP-dependent 2-oxoacid decarboxylase